MVKILLLSFAFFVTTQGFSQKNSNYLKIHGGAEIPVGFFNEGYPTGWGFHATDYLGVSEGGSFLLTAGVAGWKARMGNGVKTNLFIVKFGYRIFAAQGLYFQVEPVGLGVYLDEYNNGSNYTYGGGIGYLFNKKRQGGFDISSKFNRISGRSWIGLNLGYQFKL